MRSVCYRVCYRTRILSSTRYHVFTTRYIRTCALAAQRNLGVYPQQSGLNRHILCTLAHRQVQDDLKAFGNRTPDMLSDGGAEGSAPERRGGGTGWGEGSTGRPQLLRTLSGMEDAGIARGKLQMGNTLPSQPEHQRLCTGLLCCLIDLPNHSSYSILTNVFILIWSRTCTHCITPADNPRTHTSKL